MATRDAEPAVWEYCVRDVLTDTYPSVSVSYSISDGLRATIDDIASPVQFELERASIDQEDDTYAVAVEAQYEAILPYATRSPSETSRPVRPYDYGPAVVVYQLFGDVDSDETDIRADVRAFPGELSNFDPSDDDATNQ